jgi:hypothetical protein
MSKHRFGSWEDGAQHPLRTLLLMFGLTAVVGTLAFYFDGVGQSLLGASAMALLCAAVVTGLSWRHISSLRGGRPVPVHVRKVSLFSVTVTVFGIGVCLVGIGLSDWGLFLAGIPLVLLGAGLIALRRWVGKRRASSFG